MHEDDEDAPVTALDGHATPAGDSEAGQILLDAITAVARLRVLMSEADENEFNTYLPRLATFLGAVGDLPTSARPSKRVGFKVPTKKARRR